MDYLASLRKHVGHASFLMAYAALLMKLQRLLPAGKNGAFAHE